MQGVRSVVDMQKLVFEPQMSIKRTVAEGSGSRSATTVKKNGYSTAVRATGVRGAAQSASWATRQSVSGSIKKMSSKVSVGANVKRMYHTTTAMRYAAEWDGVEKEVLSMPALSPSMTTGNVVAWVKKEGDKINPGDVIAEIETDKATVAFEATESGFLAKILKPAGAKDIAVSDPIAIVVAKKDLVSKFANYVHSSGSSGSSGANASSAPAPSSSSSSSSSAPQASQVDVKKPSVPHTVLQMPSLSPTMEDGVIVSWNKAVGDKITAGDVLAEIETDKATVAFEATEDGYLAKILKNAGEGRIKVNTPVALVVDKKGDIDAVKDYDPSVSAAPQSAGSAPQSTQTSSASSSSSSASSGSSSGSASKQSSDGRIIASPYAKLLSKEKNVPIGEVSGSGPNGRIIARDVLSFVPSSKSAQTQSATKSAAASSVSDAGYFDDVSVSNIRRITAERLTQSKTTIPHYYLTMDVEVDELMKVREELNNGAKGEFKLSVNDFVVKASALAMKKVPQVNSQWLGDVIRQYHNVDINVAVSTETGLLTPIVRDADLHGLVKIASTIKQSAQNAKDGKISPSELAIGTFTISNLGMFGIDHFSAVILPPQACILAVGASKPRVVPNAGTAATTNPFIVKNYMSVTLSCDHRVVDGAIGAKWLQAFKDLIENPMKLLL